MSSINSKVPPLRLMAVDTPSDGQLPSYQSSSGKFEWVDDTGGGTPGTPAQAIQFNSDPAGTFTGSSRLLYDNSGNDSIIEMSSGLSTTQPIIKSTGGRGITINSTSTDDSDRNSLVLYGENDAPDGIGLFPASGLYVTVGDSTSTPAKITTRGSGADLELTTNLTDNKAKVTLVAGSNGNVEIQAEGTGSTEIQNATTNQDSQLLIRGNGTGTPKLLMTNDTKSITLQCDENNKFKVQGALYDFIFDASSATGGITWPDGTTQTTAASGTSPGGSDGDFQINNSGAFGGSILSTNKTTTITLNSGASGDPQLQMSSNTKAITLTCDTNSKLKVEGALYSWELDASSASGGITFPDGTTQTTAASGGGGGDANFITSAMKDFDTRTNQAYSLYWPFYPVAQYSQPTGSTAASLSAYTVGYPFVAQSTGNIAGLSVRCTTAGNDLFHVAIYETDSDLWPSSLVGLAKFDCSTTGAKRVTTFYETDGTTTTNISLTTGNVYWVLYGNISGDTSVPTLGSLLNTTYHISTIGTNGYANGGGYNQRGTMRLRIGASQGTTTTDVFPATYTNYSTINSAIWYNSSNYAMPIWIGVG